jgi:hypothetical protein
VNYIGRQSQQGRTDPRILTPEDQQIAEAITGTLVDTVGGGLVAQVNPTYPSGDPRYGRPMEMGGQPMSMSEAEYDWTQRMNELRRANLSDYGKVKSMMGPYGWTQPPNGFRVPEGI